MPGPGPAAWIQLSRLELALDVLGAAATNQAAVHLGELSIDGLATLRALLAVGEGKTM